MVGISLKKKLNKNFRNYAFFYTLFLFISSSANSVLSSPNNPYNLNTNSIFHFSQSINAIREKDSTLVSYYKNKIQDADLKSTVNWLYQNANPDKTKEDTKNYLIFPSVNKRQIYETLSIPNDSEKITPKIQYKIDNDTTQNIKLSGLENKEIKLQRSIKATRLAMQNNSHEADYLLKKVKQNIKKDSLLFLDYIGWKIKRSEYKDILLDKDTLEHLKNFTSKNNRELIWRYKCICIRNILEQKEVNLYPIAYEIAKNHGDVSGPIFADGEWLAGWIAGNFLGDKELAYKHFVKLYELVYFPNTISKAAYWSGRMASTRSDSIRWYKIASSYRTTFYGQIALLYLKPNGNLNLQTSEKSYNEIDVDHLSKIINISYKINEYKLARFLLSFMLKNSKDDVHKSKISLWCLKNDMPYLALISSIDIQKQGEIIVESLFPIKNEYENNVIEPEITLSLIKKESAFNPNARSPKGALGLMQMVPLNAKQVATRNKIEYKDKKSLLDAETNISIGTHYFKELLFYYDNSLILSLCAYNAGKRHTNTFIKLIGDVRKLQTLEEKVDWIESIPFYETREYVKEVMSCIQVYKYIKNKTSIEKMYNYL